MADWRMAGTYFKSCSCDPGCPCDFMSEPTHHECEGILGMQVTEGHHDGVSLDGIKWAAAYHWPGPLHEGNGTVKPYFDVGMSDEQKNALGQILMGQSGGTWFEVVASIVSDVKEPAVVPVDVQVSGRKGTVKIGDAIENEFAPIKNPVTDEDERALVQIPGGMEYSGEGYAEILQSSTLRSSDEIAFDRPRSHVSLVENQEFGSHR
jgi:hypothetical protein